MELLRPDHFEIVVAANGEPSVGLVEETLSRSGYRFHTVERDLHGLKEAASVKPNAIVLVGLTDSAENWVLNFVSDTPSGPAILAVEEPSVLSEPPEWLYDIVSPGEVEHALGYRLNLALRFVDMLRLTAERSERLGLSRAQIGMISMVDVVTGLFNLRYFEKHLRESFAAAKRYGRDLTCLVVRIENFPTLVEEYGRERSNDILDTIALALTAVIRQADTAARIDDDLFGFLLPETPEAGAERVVQRLIERFKRTEYPHDAQVSVGASFAQLGQSHDTPRALLDEAVAGLGSRPDDGESTGP